MLEGDRYSWEGRKLTRFRQEFMQETLLDVNYAYDANGLRISKKAGTVEHKYFYDGGNLVSEVVGSTYLRFGYDEKGLLSCLTYNDGTTSTRYFYVRDILLNIIGLKDMLGNLVVRYNYDAWGNMVSITGSGANTIGQANPFRYKGYYYDTETMMYYCQTRYYVPAWCRWLNADNPGYLNFESPEGINLFSYCGNNPVNTFDPSGHSALLIGLIIGLVLAFGAVTYYDYRDDGKAFNGSVAWYEYLGATIAGGLLGAVIGIFAVSSFTFTLPTLGFAFQGGGAAILSAAGSISITVSGAEILAVSSLAALVVMEARIGKSGGYRINHNYPNDHDPIHVHIYGDDIIHGVTRVDMSGNVLPGDSPLTTGARRAFWRLIQEILRTLKPWL